MRACPAFRGRPVASAWVFPAERGGSRLKVFEGLARGVEPGSTISLAELGLPVSGTRGALLVFWKST